MNPILKGTFALIASAFWIAASAAPALSVSTVSVSRPDIKVWNIKSTSEIREGSTTSTEDAKIKVQRSDGSSATHDAKISVKSKTLFQDGEICHNYGPACYCARTTFRLESGAGKWKFGTPSDNRKVACPNGITPTGDPEIRKGLTKEEARARRDEVRKERAAAREAAQNR